MPETEKQRGAHRKPVPEFLKGLHFEDTCRLAADWIVENTRLRREDDGTYIMADVGLRKLSEALPSSTIERLKCNLTSQLTLEWQTFVDATIEANGMTDESNTYVQQIYSGSEESPEWYRRCAQRIDSLQIEGSHCELGLHLNFSRAAPALKFIEDLLRPNYPADNSVQTHGGALNQAIIDFPRGYLRIFPDRIYIDQEADGNMVLKVA